MITVEDLIFEYPGVRALDGVGFALPERSITALVGPNGAGKSTLMRCIVGLETPLAGRVRIGALDVQQETRQSHRLLGFLSDFYGLYDELTARRCLLYRAGAMGVPPQMQDAAVEEAAGRCDLVELLERKAGELSRGQRQRLAIAQALVHGPRVLLLDEPASGLDPAARAALSALLRQLRTEGLTIVVSSHILAELEDYSTHMLAMEHGRVRLLQEIAAAQAGAARRRFALQLAAPDARLAELLSEVAGLADLELDERSARFTLPADETRQAELLAALIGQGLPVCAFRAETESMEQTYLGLMERPAS